MNHKRKIIYEIGPESDPFCAALIIGSFLVTFLGIVFLIGLTF